MAIKRPRRASRRVTLTAFAKLERSLEEYSAKVEHLEREVQINIRRIGAMQAEIDHLRGKVRG